MKNEKSSEQTEQKKYETVVYHITELRHSLFWTNMFLLFLCLVCLTSCVGSCATASSTMNIDRNITQMKVY